MGTTSGAWALSILDSDTDVRERSNIVCSVKMDPKRTVVPCSLRGYLCCMLVGVR